MICSNCENEITDGAKFCADCGVQVGAVIQATGKAKHSFLKSTFDSAGQSVKDAATSAKNIGGLLANQIGDLNGDGKIDAEDFKIAVGRAKQIAIAVGDETVKLGKSAMQSGLVKEAAAGALVGGAIASVVPVLGTATGAVVGATLVAYKHITK